MLPRAFEHSGLPAGPKQVQVRPAASEESHDKSLLPEATKASGTFHTRVVNGYPNIINNQPPRSLKSNRGKIYVSKIKSGIF